MEQQANTTTEDKKGKLKTLFKTVLRKPDVKAAANTHVQLEPPTSTTDSWEMRRAGETYHNYGNRICARVTAAPYALSAFLHKIFNIEKQAQINNMALQAAFQQNIRQQITNIDAQIRTTKSDIDKIEVSRKSAEESIERLKDEITDLKANNGQVNKPAKIKLIIGGIILTLLTVYLFVFYSSTFYSAFFKDFMDSGSTDVGTHMFDSNAFASSLAAGFGQLIFVLSAPIIFLGLGFSLHYFSKERGFFKYVKITLVIIVTFIFDCILAYSIAKNIHMIEEMSSIGEMSEYGISQALTDRNVLAVIFCGFIVYIIWGIVFNLTMTAYEELRSNKNEQIKLLDKIQTYQNRIRDIDIQKMQLDTQVKNHENAKNNLLQNLNNQTIVDNSPIKVALNDFYAGWMAMMPNLGCSSKMQEEAQNIYKDNIATLIPQNNAANTQGNISSPTK